MAEGFLDRWSQRKQAVREGKAVVEPSPPEAESVGEGLAAAPEPTPIPAPTLEDVKALTLDSNFAPFVARDVAPEVRNAAMKKLFADPHYNVLDRLDIYIDDYSKPDPLPETMLRTMVGAKFLNLFEEEKTPEAPLRDDPHTPSVDSVAQSVQLPKPDHDHPDLRLQPNHAAGRPEPGGSAQ